MNRRQFLKNSVSTTFGIAAASAMPASSWANVAGANNDIRVAVVGLGGQGWRHAAKYRNIPGVRITALCDVDEKRFDRTLKVLEGTKQKPKLYKEYRKLLEDKNVDAISIVTPNHWHSLQGIWACQAGKDATVEKPVSHNIFEGRKLVAASRKYNCLIQGDFDSRSIPGLRQAVSDIQKGEFGKIVAARGYIYKRRTSIGKVKGPHRVSDSVDYDLWTGPAPLKPLMRNRLHYVWHWVWDTGNGELGNNGPHHLDLCRWVLGYDRLPRRVMSAGGRFGYIDDGETPNTQFVYYDYGDVPIVYEFRGLGDTPVKFNDPKFVDPQEARMEQYRGVTRKGIPFKTFYKGRGVHSGVLAECEGGYVDLYGLVAYDYKGKVIKKWDKEDGDPKASFIKAVRSRKRSDLRNDILEGHLSTALSHLGNISYRLGAQSSPEQVQEVIKGNKDLMEVFGRFQIHLAKHNIDFGKTPLKSGPMLEFDSEKEKFVGDWSREANMFLSRNYRRPYVVPEKV